jgi:hypothetical protein
MPGCEALRAPDAHDYEEPGSEPADPCPVCMGPVEDRLCFLCGALLCEACGRAEVGDQAACCVHCAPVYEVATMARPYYIGRNLRRAYEAQSYLHAAGYLDALITVPKRVDLDFDGLSDRENEVLQAWDIYDGGSFLSIQTCIAPSKARP